MERTGSLFLRNVLISALLFGLFAEWLRPLAFMAELTEVHRLTPFLGAIGFYMLIDALGIRGWLGWPIKLAFTAGWIGYWFQPEAMFGDWWVMAAKLFAEDVRGLVQGDPWISPELRTLLFLAGWSAIVYAVYRIAAERSQAVWFVAATLTFLMLLQLWPGVDTTWGVLRTSAMGLLLLAVLNGPKWERLTGYRFSPGGWASFARASAGIGCGLLVLGASYGLTSGESREVVPVTIAGAEDWFERVAAAGLAEGRSAVSGYGAYDGRLGAPVTPDAGIAFEAKTARPANWRGETKDVYTGHGWRESGLSDDSRVFASVDPAAGSGAAKAVEQEIAVKHPELGQIVFTGGTIASFAALTDSAGEPVPDIHIRVRDDNDSYFVGTDAIRLGSYRMDVVMPVLSEAALLQDDGDPDSGASRRYLQLPDKLPERVGELARSIVADVPDNRYMRVLAIQHYLRSNYTYTLDTELPPRDADFVDHFLFVTREGYCNHFSTAMVVLLRSIGIEARWAKGFAPGEEDAERPGTYVVRNSDAHSWVEVRFAQAGWVPFEATPGFGSPVRSDAAGNAAAVRSAAASAGSGGQAALTEAADGSVAGAKALWAAWKERAEERLRALRERLPGDWRLPAMIAAGAALGIGALYAGVLAGKLLRGGTLRLRRSAAPASAVWPQQRRLDALWRRMYCVYGSRPPAETMREYAQRLPLKTPEARAALFELVRYDEAVRFGGEDERRASRSRLDQLWRRMAE